MLRSRLLLVACLAGMMPAVASAAVILKVQERLIPVPGGFAVDLVFETTGEDATRDEQLAFYDLGLRLVKRGGAAGGITFVAPFADKVPNADGYVFPDTAEFTVAEADADSILANVSANTTANFDITTGKKAGRLYLSVDPLTSPDTFYEIQFDPDLTIFAAGAGDDPVIPVVLQSGRVFIPEPSGLMTLGAGLLALRRFRRL